LKAYIDMMVFGYADCKSNKHGPRPQTHVLTDIYYTVRFLLYAGENHGTVLEYLIQHYYSLVTV